MAVETYSQKKVTLTTLGQLSFCVTNCGAFRQGIYWVSKNHPEFACPIINEMLSRMAPFVDGLWQSGKVTQAMLQTDKFRDHPKRRAFEACGNLLRNADPQLRKHADAGTITHLQALSAHPSLLIARPAGVILMKLDQAPPEAVARRFLRLIEEGNHHGIDGAGKRYRAAIAKVAREWQTVCEKLAEAVYGRVLLDSRRETLLSNETRPDIIVDDGSVKRDDHGTICFCELCIDAKSGDTSFEHSYVGWCRRLEYWIPGTYWTKPWKALRTTVSVRTGTMLCELAIEHDRQDLALEVGRLMGPDGNYTWRWVHSFIA